jgi:hypothetical protein
MNLSFATHYDCADCRASERKPVTGCDFLRFRAFSLIDARLQCSRFCVDSFEKQNAAAGSRTGLLPASAQVREAALLTPLLGGARKFQ